MKVKKTYVDIGPISFDIFPMINLNKKAQVNVKSS